jgi:hypothetical protein
MKKASFVFSAIAMLSMTAAVALSARADDSANGCRSHVAHYSERTEELENILRQRDAMSQHRWTQGKQYDERMAASWTRVKEITTELEPDFQCFAAAILRSKHGKEVTITPVGGEEFTGTLVYAGEQRDTYGMDPGPEKYEITVRNEDRSSTYRVALYLLKKESLLGLLR